MHAHARGPTVTFYIQACMTIGPWSEPGGQPGHIEFAPAGNGWFRGVIVSAGDTGLIDVQSDQSDARDKSLHRADDDVANASITGGCENLPCPREARHTIVECARRGRGALVVGKPVWRDPKDLSARGYLNLFD